MIAPLRALGLVLTLVVALLASSPVAAEASLPSFLTLEGNVLFVDQVYASVLDLPDDAGPTKETAALIRSQLLAFLYSSGYELATVRITLQDGTLHAEINEGHIEKILILGRGMWTTFKLKLAFSLPHHIFNRPFVEEQLALIKKDFGIKTLEYSLVPTPPIPHVGPQIRDTGTVFGYKVIPPPSYYDLHVILSKTGWGNGFGIDIDYNSTEGLLVGLKYKASSFVLSDDRFVFQLGAGGNLMTHLDDGSTFPLLTRGLVTMTWYTPSLFVDGFRPKITLGSDLVGRKHSELGLSMYMAERADATIALDYEFVEGLSFALGGGFDTTYIFGVDQLPEPRLAVQEKLYLRPYGQASFDLVFDPHEPRQDHLHRFAGSVRYYGPHEAQAFYKVKLGYQVTIPIWWHELHLSLRGVAMGGAHLFFEEEPVGGKYLRALFGSRYYVERLTALTVEFRFSLVRDLMKISVFHDAAVFAPPYKSPAYAPDDVILGDSFGMGLHVLILDAFQLNVYYALGFVSDETFDHGASFSLVKVF